ncbi:MULTISPECIES: TolC family protein [unclassified Tenacibaculum]|uniref:TolC family protein n=1 Tax=unclassified Tenacibaculum TaxID=2635139 RepID=UPI001F1B46C3|nr:MULTISPECIES: TolC family protein [unclassified Tenacibaculum]MCF2873808.1 TolC family protein [Tenacibaculum sp. Cn5-1]MCF2933964.1 TolC family protein [Tenacibaculum sp. Cn5-34]MCG7509454.1 TolC family protein [Tenacibaculum sp. Cn5-46]
MRRIIYAVCIFFFALSSNAQEKEMSLSMREAIQFAIKNSYNNKVALNDIEAAKKRKWETTAIGFPQISGVINYQNNLKQQFPGVDFNGDGTVDFGAKHNVTGTVTLDQLLFDGSYLVGLQSARTYLKISEQAKEKTELSTREAVINAYGNVLVAEERIEILKGNKKTVDRQLKGAVEGFKQGLTEEETVEQFKITQGNIISQQRNADRNREIAYQMLNLSLGNPINTKLKLTDSLDDLVVNNTDLNLLAQSFNLKNHIDFRIAENDREAKRLLMKLEKNKALPTVRAYVNYSRLANADSFNFFNSSQDWISTSVFGVGINIPIFSSLGRSAKTAQAKIALESADIRLAETKQRLNLQAEQAQSNYELSIENYETAKKNLALATRIERKQKIKFDEGVTTSIDLLAARNQLYSQQNNYLQSILNIISNKAKLDNALNTPIK